MLNNKILYDIYKSVKYLDKDRMNKNTENIKRIIIKLNNQYQYGGTKESEENYQEIITNLDAIQTGFLNYFKSLQGYIDIYLKNAEEFEKLFKDRLSIESLKKLQDSMNQLNVVLDKLK